MKAQGAMLRWRKKSHPHGCVSWNLLSRAQFPHLQRHTLTGVWVEIRTHQRRRTACRHTLTGVWVEISWISCCISKIYSHTLTGVWVEIAFHHQVTWCDLESHPHGCVSWNNLSIYPSHIIGMSHPHGCVSWNHCRLAHSSDSLLSHPHGCVSWNRLVCAPFILNISHTLTGVWVEI